MEIPSMLKQAEARTRQLEAALRLAESKSLPIDWKAALSDIHKAGINRPLLAGILGVTPAWLRWTDRKDKYKDTYYEMAVKIKHVHKTVCPRTLHSERFFNWGKVSE